jgi:hypothetical protein
MSPASAPSLKNRSETVRFSNEIDSAENTTALGARTTRRITAAFETLRAIPDST